MLGRSCHQTTLRNAAIGVVATLTALFSFSPHWEVAGGEKTGLANYIDTSSDARPQKKQPSKVTLTSSVRAEATSTFANRGPTTVIVEEPPLYRAPAECCPTTSCWQTCFHGFWVRGEYLHWWTDAMDIPPLVTTSLAGTTPNTAGVLLQPGTQTLLGSGDLGGSGQSGARISAGWWIDPSACRGFEANYFHLGTKTSSFATDSASTPILARPVFDTGTSSETAMLVAHPDFLTGTINVDATTELQGAEALFRRRLFQGCDSRVDFLFGYRFAKLDESLNISQSSLWTATQGAIVAGTTQNLFDSFATDNQFHGGELGIAYTQQYSCWSLDATMKMALGNNRSTVTIDGQTVNTVPAGGSATFVGGLLAQQTNIGRYERDAFGFIPELTITARRDVTCNLSISVGYNLMYWTATLRPGDQIDRQVSQFPPEAPMGTQRPAFNFQSGSFWAQGLNLGLAYQF
ncbi:MAG: BBP7 family outer membrane beta-barrel protein [Planctomycetaceae bacterium]|nr:BBP7 family outer membrane beta-barrel protein [Planctomycetales bacterium]MCB9927085.1 BBP7 family outer membrane beta-barrel protein [Planctomycetaceae bacterium]